jgi:Fuc2NAc and GlcNAc transferase
MLLYALLSIFISAICSFVISKYGNKFAFIDKPNERSSHTTPTPRGGGIGMMLAFVVVGFLFTKNYAVVSVIGCAGVLGLLDDRFTFPSKLRLIIQIILSILAIVFVSDSPPTVSTIILFLFWIVFITGTTNFYNFMDGINGIAGLTGLVGFGLVAYFAFFIAGNKDITFMSIILSAACLGFLPFNFPKAKVFMGDVGSMFLGFAFAVFVVKLSTNLNVFLCLIMFIYLFYADAIVTFFCRLWKRENLLQSHRDHLYQYMCNELAIPHWKVSSLYATVQLILGVLSLFAYSKGPTFQFTMLGIFMIYFIGTYRVVTGVKK